MQLLLHACCAPCASTAVERLLGQGHGVTLFFSGHNIDTREEHDLRLAHVRRLAAHFGVPLLVDQPEFAAWHGVISGHEGAPEHGSRCALCFRYVLARTMAAMHEKGLDAFSTTLTTSPHKNAQLIFQIGIDLAGERYVPMDFKKNDGFKRSVQLSRELSLYRQSYCGCVFSKNRIA